MAALLAETIVQAQQLTQVCPNAARQDDLAEITESKTMALAHETLSSDFGVIRRLSKLFANYRESRQRNRVFRQTLKELNSLTNRELADLGIPRSMITRVAQEAAYGK